MDAVSFPFLLYGLSLMAALGAGGHVLARRRRRRRLEESTLLIGEAMRRLDLQPADPAASSMEVRLADAVMACRRCTCTDACRAWLRGDLRSAPRSCANVRAFAEWQVVRDARRRAGAQLPPFAPL